MKAISCLSLVIVYLLIFVACGKIERGEDSNHSKKKADLSQKLVKDTIIKGDSGVGSTFVPQSKSDSLVKVQTNEKNRISEVVDNQFPSYQHTQIELGNVLKKEDKNTSIVTIDNFKGGKRQTIESKGGKENKNKIESSFFVYEEVLPIIRITNTARIDERYPTISPDGKLLAFEGWFLIGSGSAKPVSLYSLSLDGLYRKNILVEGQFYSVRPYFHINNDEVFFITNAYNEYFYLASSRLNGGDSINLNYRKYCNNVLGVAVSPKSQLAICYKKNEQSGIVIGILDSKGIFYPDVAEGSEVSWSNDGSRLIFVNENGSFIDIFSMKADGTDLTQLTTHFGICQRPSYSPDGMWIVFSGITETTKKYDLFIMSKDGTDILQLTHASENDKNPIWGKDGWIYFETERFDANSEIAKIDGNNIIKVIQSKREPAEFLK